MEIWKEIEESPGYEVSNQGRVRNMHSHFIYANYVNPRGVIVVKYGPYREQETRQLSLLVARAFIPELPNHWATSIIHLDGDRLNCAADNLMWRSRPYALRYHRMFKQEPFNVGVYVTDTDETFETLREFCVKYGIVEEYAYDCAVNGLPLYYCNFVIKLLDIGTMEQELHRL